MCYLYASKPGVERKLVATFDSDAQLLAYVGWATLGRVGRQSAKRPAISQPHDEPDECCRESN